MPLTPPVLSVINRQIEDQETLDLLKLYSQALEEIVNKGSQLLKLASSEVNLERHQYAVIVYFRQILEGIDAIGVLMSVGAAPPCEVIQRTLLEVYLGFEYLLKEDTERRANVYEFFSYMQQIKRDEKHSPTHSDYANYQEQYKHGNAIKQVPVYPDLQKRLTTGRQYKNHPENADYLNEYSRLKKMKRSFEWYSFYSEQTNNGELIRTCQQLATHLNKFDWYEILYKEYSKPIHGSSMVMMNMYRSQDHINLIGLRHLYRAYDLINMTLRISELAFRQFVNTILDGVRRSEIVWWEQAFKKNFVIPIGQKRIQIDDLK